MAINVNTVYTTVLSIINKEQRGYISPDEFNKLATQAQLDIFENYFEDLNQQLRIQQTDNEYADRQKNIDNLISIFKTISNPTYIQVGAVNSLGISNGGTGYSSANNVSTTGGSGSGLTVNIQVNSGIVTLAAISSRGSGYQNGDIVTINAGNTDATLLISSVNLSAYFLPSAQMHRIGTVIYKNEKEIQRVDRNEFLLINKSLLTKPTTEYPVYIYEQSLQGASGNNTGQPHLYIYPTTITNNSDITISYIRKPANPYWGFTVGTLGQYVYSSTASVQFELDATEQTELIIRILAYAGVIIRDPQIVQVAQQAIQSEEINSKS